MRKPVLVFGCLFSVFGLIAFGYWFREYTNQKKLTTEISQLVKNHYYDEKVAARAELITSGEKIVSSLPDRYSRFLSQEEYAFYQTLKSGEYTGFGFSYDYNWGEAIIYQVYPNSAAEKAGLEVGDVIEAVDGITTEAFSKHELEKELSVHFADQLSLEISRQDETYVFDLIVDSFKLESVEYRRLSEKLGYLKIYTFLPDTRDQLIEIIDQLIEDPLTHLVIDLRGNNGGAAESSFLLAEELVLNGDIVRQEQPGKNPEVTRVSGEGRLTNLEVIVLVNRYTASEAEVLTAALQDNGRAVVVGEQTYGKGLTVTHYPLLDGSALQLSTQAWFRPSGESIEGIGIIPDVNPDDIGNWSVIPWAEVW